MNPKGFSLEQHVERVSAEPGTIIDTHIDAKVLALDPLADAGKVVLVQEGEWIGLQGMVQIDRHIPIEVAILSEHEDSESAIVAVFLLLEVYLDAFVVVGFHCVDD